MTSLSCLSGCAAFVGAQGGAAVLATRRGHTPVAASFNAREDLGLANGDAQAAVLLGAEANGRVTNDYGHVDLGLNGGVMGASSRWLGYGFLSLDPVGGSVRDRVSYYAFSSGLEIGGGYSWNGEQDPGRFIIHTSGEAITLSLRGDVELRPAQPQADVFVGLMVGFAGYGLVNGR